MIQAPLRFSRQQFTTGPWMVDLIHPPDSGDAFSPDAMAAFDRLRANDHEGAMAALRERPQSLAAAVMKGYLQHEAGDFAGVIETLQHPVDVNPSHPTASYQLGLAYLHAQQFGDAATALRRHLTVQPQDREARVVLSLALLQTGILHEAHQEIKRLLELCPGDRDGQVLMAQYLHLVGRRDDALAWWDACLRENPDAELPLVALLALSIEADHRPAIDDTRRLLEARSELSPIAQQWLMIGTMHLADYEAALDRARQLVMTYPTFAAWHNLGFAAHHRGELAEAERGYRQALLLEPNATESMINLAAVLEEQGHTEDALEWLRRAAAVDPTQVIAPWNLALLSERQEDFATAETYYGQVTEVYTEWPEGWYRCGLSALRQRLGAEGAARAVHCFKQALRLRPTWPEVRLAMAYALYEAGRPEVAASYLVELQESGYRSSLVQAALATCPPPASDADETRRLDPQE